MLVLCKSIANLRENWEETRQTDKILANPLQICQGKVFSQICKGFVRTSLLPSQISCKFVRRPARDLRVFYFFLLFRCKLVANLHGKFSLANFCRNKRVFLQCNLNEQNKQIREVIQLDQNSALPDLLKTLSKFRVEPLN